MKTLQDALFEQSGAAQVAVVDQEEMARQTAAVNESRNPPRTDTRQPGNLARELKILRLNYKASEDDRKAAEREVNDLTGYHARLTKELKKMGKLFGPAAADAANRLEKKLEECDAALNDPRTGAKEKLDRHTRIGASRAKLIEEFLSAKPYPDAPTNGEVIENDRKIEEALDAIRESDLTVSQPAVGVGIRRAE